jgi:hypothetical protein
VTSIISKMARRESAFVCVLSDSNMVLLGRERVSSAYAGRHGMPGGKLESTDGNQHGDRMAECADRMRDVDDWRRMRGAWRELCQELYSHANWSDMPQFDALWKRFASQADTPVEVYGGLFVFAWHVDADTLNMLQALFEQGIMLHDADMEACGMFSPFALPQPVRRDCQRYFAEHLRIRIDTQRAPYDYFAQMRHNTNRDTITLLEHMSVEGLSMLQQLKLRALEEPRKDWRSGVEVAATNKTQQEELEALLCGLRRTPRTRSDIPHHPLIKGQLQLITVDYAKQKDVVTGLEYGRAGASTDLGPYQDTGMQRNFNRQRMNRLVRCYSLPWEGTDVDMRQAHMAFYCEVMIDEGLAQQYELVVRIMSQRDRMVARVIDVYDEITDKDQVKEGLFLRMMYNRNYDLQRSFKEHYNVLPPHHDATPEKRADIARLDNDLELLIKGYWLSMQALFYETDGRTVKPKFEMFVRLADTTKNNMLGSASSLLFQSIEDTLLMLAYDFLTNPIEGHDGGGGNGGGSPPSQRARPNAGSTTINGGFGLELAVDHLAFDGLFVITDPLFYEGPDAAAEWLCRLGDWIGGLNRAMEAATGWALVNFADKPLPYSTPYHQNPITVHVASCNKQLEKLKLRDFSGDYHRFCKGKNQSRAVVHVTEPSREMGTTCMKTRHQPHTEFSRHERTEFPLWTVPSESQLKAALEAQVAQSAFDRGAPVGDGAPNGDDAPNGVADDVAPRLNPSTKFVRVAHSGDKKGSIVSVAAAFLKDDDHKSDEMVMRPDMPPGLNQKLIHSHHRTNKTYVTNAFNEYQGLQIQPVQGVWPKLHKLMWYVLCNGGKKLDQCILPTLSPLDEARRRPAPAAAASGIADGLALDDESGGGGAAGEYLVPDTGSVSHRIRKGQFKVLVAFLGSMVRTPWIKSLYMLCFYGPRGCGKSTVFSDYVMPLFGAGIHGFSTSTAEHLIGNFNSVVANLIFGLLEEADTTGQNANALKHLLQDTLQMITLKGVDSSLKATYGHFVSLGNDVCQHKAEHDCRMQHMFDCAAVPQSVLGFDLTSPDFRKTIDRERQAFLYFLLYDPLVTEWIGDYPPTNHAKSAEFFQHTGWAIKSVSLNGVERWVLDQLTLVSPFRRMAWGDGGCQEEIDLLLNQSADGSRIQYSKDEMFTVWQEWRSREKRRTWKDTVQLDTAVQFTTTLNKIFPIERFQQRINQRTPNQMYVLSFPDFDSLRTRFAEHVKTIQSLVFPEYRPLPAPGGGPPLPDFTW